jgi:O-antigen ligase
LKVFQRLTFNVVSFNDNSYINWRNILTACVVLVLGFLLLTQSPFVVIGLVVGVAAFLFVSRRPEFGLYLLVLSVPGQAYTSLNLGGSKVTLTQLAVLLALSGWFCNRILTKQPFIPRPTPLLLPFYGLYLLVMFVSLTVAKSTGDGLNEISRWLIASFAYLLAVTVIQTRKQLWLLVGCLCAGPVAEGLLGWAQLRFETVQKNFIGCADISRACGTFEMPNSYGGYLEMGLPLLGAVLLLAFVRRNETARAWATRYSPALNHRFFKIFSLFILLAVGIVFILLGFEAAASRGAQIGIGFAVVIMVLVRGKKALPVIFVALGIIVLVLAGVQTEVIPLSTFGRLAQIESLTPFDVRDVAVTPDNFAEVERMAMWQAGGNMYLSNPFLGIGIGNYNARYTDFNAPFWKVSRGHAHNYYIQAAAETGTIGLVAYLFLLGCGIGQGLRAAVRTKDTALRYVAWGAFGTIMAVAVHNIFEDLHVLNMGIQWSCLLALFYLVNRLDKAPKGEEKALPDYKQVGGA